MKENKPRKGLYFAWCDYKNRRLIEEGEKEESEEGIGAGGGEKKKEKKE